MQINTRLDNDLLALMVLLEKNRDSILKILVDIGMPLDDESAEWEGIVVSSKRKKLLAIFYTSSLKSCSELQRRCIRRKRLRVNISPTCKTKVCVRSGEEGEGHYHS